MHHLTLNNLIIAATVVIGLIYTSNALCLLFLVMLFVNPIAGLQITQLMRGVEREPAVGFSMGFAPPPEGSDEEEDE